MIHANDRDREAYAIIGGNQQGKSSLVKKLIDAAYDKRKDKVIVLNSSNPRAFQEYFLASQPKQLQRKWNGVVRYHNADGYKQTVEDVWNLVQDGYMRSGCVVFDDCTKYIDEKTPEHIRYFLVDRAMYDIDIIFTTHALAFLPKFIRRMVNVVVVFKTGDGFKVANDLYRLNYPNHEKIFAAYQEVMNLPQSKEIIQPHIAVATGI